MNRPETVKFLAELVHRGKLDAKRVQQALGRGDPVEALIADGAITRAQWDDWVETRGGTRPRLTRYELQDQLGEGGQARVFRAVDRTSGDIVALKVLRPELAGDAAVVARFVAESKLLIDLDCEHIVKGKRVAREGPTIFCAMELIDGANLQQQLAEQGPLSESDALRVVRQVARALSVLQARGLVHRDVKPGNVMVARGRAVLIDLGFAIPTGGPAADSATTVGTVAYISPEQARGQTEIDVRADIYSLGATLYHLVIGALPFAGASNQEVLAKQVLDSLSGDEIRAMNLSPQVHWLIEKMMAKEKEIRFQDPAQVVAEIDAVLAQWEREAEAERQSGGSLRERDRDRRRRGRR